MDGRRFFPCHPIMLVVLYKELILFKERKMKIDNMTRNILLGCAIVLSCSIGYYFVFALPASHKERLAWERQKHDNAVLAEIEKQQAKDDAEAERKTKVLGCQIRGDDAYWEYVKLNGEKVPGKKDVWSASDSVWSNARKRKQDTYDECMEE